MGPLCDAINTSSILYTLARNTASEVTSDFISVPSVSSNFFGPTLKLGIVSFATSDITHYTSYAFATNLAYALHNGYSILFYDETMTETYDTEDVRWYKIKILLDAMDPVKGWAKDLDYLVWVDADLIFLDLDFRLESVVSSFPFGHMYASAGNTSMLDL
jgi:hypothetical protein